MSVDRIKRINELIRRELALGLFHVGQGEDAEVGRVTFVDVDVSRDLRGATVAVSILGTEEQAARLMTWLRRHRTDFQTHIAKTVALKYTPKLFFKQTQSIEKGDRVLGILSEIVIPSDSDADSDDAPDVDDNEERV